MTIAVHEPSNSLIVTAPEQLFQEVEALAKLVDSRSAQAVEIVTFSNAAGMEAVLQQIFSDRRTTTTGGGATASPRPASPGPTTPSAPRPIGRPARQFGGR